VNHPTNTVVIMVCVVVVALALLAWLYWRKRRSAQLKDRFGPEYERVLREKGDVRKAEGVLEWRAKQRQQLRIVPLSSSVRADFADRWTQTQSRFVDDPMGAVSEADDLVAEVMGARGYPVANFEQQVEIVSVDHPDVVQNYRSAHLIALRHSQGQASTEDLRKAMVHYRSLFDELLEDATHHQRRKTNDIPA
jgi:hypothetical protein